MVGNFHSVISIYPINSLRVYVFLPKSNEKFYLMKVRKQLAPRQEIIISPPEIANHWDKDYLGYSDYLVTLSFLGSHQLFLYKNRDSRDTAL